MANVLTVVWFIIGWSAMQTCLMVWLALMLPNPVARARQQVETKPGWTFSLGALFWLITIAFAVNLLKHDRPGPVQLFGWISAGPMLACSVIGGAAFAQILGERFRSRSPQMSEAAALFLGALCTASSGLLPVIGWFVFLPVVGFISIGAGLNGILGSRGSRTEPLMADAQGPTVSYPVPQHRAEAGPAGA